MFHLVQLLTCWKIFLELNSKRVNRSSRKEKESFCLVFTYSTKREISHLYLVLVQWRQRNVQKKQEARTELLSFAYLIYCFFDVLVAVAFVSLSLIKPRANGRNIVGCYMLRLLLGVVVSVCTSLQYERNNTQHCWCNNVGSCCISLHLAKAVGKIMLYLLGSSWLLWEI